MKEIKKQFSKLGYINNSKTNLKQEYSKAIKDEDFEKIVSNLKLNDDELMKYTSKLQDCANEYKHCKQCSTIIECKNDVKGYVVTPEVQSKIINFTYLPCQFQKKIIASNKYQQNAYYFDVPKEIKDAKMKDIYTNDKSRLEVIAWLKNFINDYENNPNQKGLYLHGNFGSGKTFLISAMFNELAKKDKKIAIIYWPEFLRDLKASFSDDFAPKYNYIKKIPLLLIDDIGAENSTSWARDEILGPLLQFRMQEKLPTFFTSNLSVEELETHFSTSNYQTEQIKGRRIIERIKQLAIEIKLISKNKRNQ